MVQKCKDLGRLAQGSLADLVLPEYMCQIHLSNVATVVSCTLNLRLTRILWACRLQKRLEEAKLEHQKLDEAVAASVESALQQLAMPGWQKQRTGTLQLLDALEGAATAAAKELNIARERSRQELPRRRVTLVFASHARCSHA